MNPKIHRCFSFCFAESELSIPFVTTQHMELLRRNIPINCGWSTYFNIASIRKETALLFPLIPHAFSETEPPFWRRISAGCLTGHGQNEAWLPGCPTDQNGRTLTPDNFKQHHPQFGGVSYFCEQPAKIRAFFQTRQQILFVRVVFLSGAVCFCLKSLFGVLPVSVFPAFSHL